MCEKDEKRMHFIREHYPEVLTVSPEECFDFVQANTEHGGADVVLEVAGAAVSYTHLDVYKRQIQSFLCLL